MPSDIPPALQYIPYLAGMQGKNEAEAAALQARVEQLPEAVKNFLFDKDLPDRLAAAARLARVPEQYAVALAKIIFLAVLGDISIDAPRQLLEKLGLVPEIVAPLSSGITEILQTLIRARGQEAAKQAMRPLPPLTTRLPPIPPAGTQPPAHTIIDLRPPDRQAGKQQPES